MIDLSREYSRENMMLQLLVNKKFNPDVLEKRTDLELVVLYDKYVKGVV